MNEDYWAVLTEGKTDIKLLMQNPKIEEYKNKNRLVFYSAGGFGSVLNARNWREMKKHTLSKQLLADTVNGKLHGIILMVDADDETRNDKFMRDEEFGFEYIDADKSNFLIDYIRGKNDRRIPICKVMVPMNGNGCIETELLEEIGYPKNEPADYYSLTEIIKKSKYDWLTNPEKWATENETAKMDKFIYNALKTGFKETKGEMKELPAFPTGENILSIMDTY